MLNAPGRFGPVNPLTCGRGGIGRRAALRSLWGNPWKFESSRPHHLLERRLQGVVFPTKSQTHYLAAGEARAFTFCVQSTDGSQAGDPDRISPCRVIACQAENPTMAIWGTLGMALLITLILLMNLPSDDTFSCAPETHFPITGLRG